MRFKVEYSMEVLPRFFLNAQEEHWLYLLLVYSIIVFYLYRALGS